jgi:hypothetical protein
VRLDFNLTKNHSLENVFNKQEFRGTYDLLNGLDPIFPGFDNAGTQNSDRRIVGSWWSHPKGQQIFDALSTIDDDDDIRCFKLVDHKITFVHRRLWPALAKLAQAGVLDADRVTAIQQEHMPTGEHRNITMPFPDWVPDDTMDNAASLSVEDAKSQLGTWLA